MMNRSKRNDAAKGRIGQSLIWGETNKGVWAEVIYLSNQSKRKRGKTPQEA